MPIYPIQEKAYGAISIASNPVNFTMVIFTYQIYYNYNPNNLTFSGYDSIQLALPINSINSTMQVNYDGDSNEINSSLIIKNNDLVLLSLNSNDWYHDLGDKFQVANFQTIHDYIKDMATS